MNKSTPVLRICTTEAGISQFDKLGEKWWLHAKYVAEHFGDDRICQDFRTGHEMMRSPEAFGFYLPRNGRETAEAIFKATRLRYRTGHYESERCFTVNSYNEPLRFHKRILEISESLLRWREMSRRKASLATSSSEKEKTIRILNVGAGDGGGFDPFPDFFNKYNGSGEGWSGFSVEGIFIEPRETDFIKLQARLAGSTVRLVNGFLRMSNVEEVLKGQYAFDWMKIDIDSNDCILLEKLLEHQVSADAIVVETDEAIPPPFVVLNVVEGTQVRERGCSLSALVQLLSSYGYYLFEYFGMDALFLHRSVNPHGSIGKDEFQCYRQLRMHLPGDGHGIGRKHIFEWLYELPTETALLFLKSNLSTTIPDNLIA